MINSILFSPLEGENVVSWNWRSQALETSRGGNTCLASFSIFGFEIQFPPLVISNDLDKLSQRNNFLPLKGGEGVLK